MNIIFYGTLKNADEVARLFDLHPTVVIKGHIVGTLFEVIDETEPNNLFRYPLFHVCGFDSISAVLMQFSPSTEISAHLIEKMSEYEGPLYTIKTAQFIAENGAIHEGMVFAWNTEASLKSATISRVQGSKPLTWE